jgi:2-hydroxy-3-oxopropionate reductase
MHPWSVISSRSKGVYFDSKYVPAKAVACLEKADVERAILGRNGVIEGVKNNSLVIDMRTIDPSVSRKVAKAFFEKNIKMLDAPARGGQIGVEAGTITIMVGG